MLALITILSTLVPALLGKFGVASSIDNLVSVSLTALVTLWGTLTGPKHGSEVDTVMVGLQAALTTLETDTTLDPVVLSDITETIADLKAAITAYEAAQVVTDPTTLEPIPDLA